MTADKKSIWGFVEPNNCANFQLGHDASGETMVCLYWSERTTPNFECAKWEAKP